MSLLRTFKYACFSIFLLLRCSAICAQEASYHKEIPDLPAQPQLVNDFAGMLSEEETKLLELKLEDFEKLTTNQLTIVTVNDLGGLDVSEFAVELGRKWDIGTAKRKNGILVLASKNDRKINISPGYGLSGVLTDVRCSRIIREQIAPNFKSQNYYQGFDEATDAIISISKGEFTNDQSEQKNGGSFLPIIIIIIFILLFIVAASRRNNSNAYLSRRGSRLNDGSGMGGIIGGILSSGLFDGNSSDSDSSGFGGFGGGGGGFDGGGASGSW